MLEVPSRGHLARTLCLIGLGIIALQLPMVAESNSRDIGVAQTSTPAATASMGWQDTGLPWLAHKSLLCLDTSQPFVVIGTEDNIGTVAYNWQTGKRTVLSTRYFDLCGPRGLLYDRLEQGAWRFSVLDPVGKPIEHMPSSVASDGSLQVYSFGNGQLWASSDGGANWELRRPPDGGTYGSNLVVSEADGKAIYATVRVAQPSTSASGQQATARMQEYLAFSADAGLTWEQRSPMQPFPAPLSQYVEEAWEPMPGATAPIDMLLRVSRPLDVSGGTFGSGTGLGLSLDGGRSLSPNDLGTIIAGRRAIRVVDTPQGIVRYSITMHRDLDRSTDGGQSWQTLSPPESLDDFAAARGVPGVLFLTGDKALWYSVDSGTNWQAVEDYTDPQVWSYFSSSINYSPYRLDVTPYFPVSVLGVKDGRLHVLRLNSGTGLQLPAIPDRGTGAHFFPETKHNVRGAFAQYWNSRGGLAQQGYPLTEPFQQVSDVDGKVYLTQYFERAVFELHPENQPPHDVLLSLLGAEAYRQKYGSEGAPGQRVSTDNPRYFPETGHTIGGKFRRYWEEHGGVAQQGYPMSDEFTETSALDGKPYTVQYFERAVMELHPENQPPHDVLLSQLGTLKAKQLALSGPGPTP